MSGFGLFSDLLRTYRAAANLTQEELAERSGLSAQAISKLERGVRRAPRPSTVELLATALSLDASQRGALVAAARSPQGGLQPAGPAATPETTAATRMLPRGISAFTGREAELERLSTAILEQIHDSRP